MFQVPLFIGLRYLRSKRRNGFVTFVSAFAMGGMALGVFALIVVMSVMNGFDHELKQRILRVIPHGYISQPQGIVESQWKSDAEIVLKHPDVTAISPFIAGAGLIDRGGATKGAVINGIDPEYEKSVSEVDEFMILGEFEALGNIRYSAVLGSLLARSIGVTVGDEIILTLPELSITPAGVFPRTKKFLVVGVFEVNAPEDQTTVLININDAQRFFRRGYKVDGLRVQFNDIYSAPRALSEIKTTLGGDFETKAWTETQGSLFDALQLEKSVTTIMLGIIIAVAAFNVITSLIMMVAEKRSDIAVLRTMGMTRRHIQAVFVIQGLATGLAGILIGVLFGIPIALYFTEIVSFFENLLGVALYDPSVYFVTQLPSIWRIDDTISVVSVSALISLLATLYPAYRASKIEPAEALRYDT